MTYSAVTGLAILLGIALYPFFSNHLPNQRQNASAVIGILLLGFMIFGHETSQEFQHREPIHVGLQVLSFIFFASAFLGRRRGEITPGTSSLVPFGIGVIAVLPDIFATTWETHVALIGVQAICLLAIIKTYFNLPAVTLIKAAYFSALYCIVNALFHVQTSIASATPVEVSGVVIGLYCFLLATCVLHMGFQDYSRTRTKKGWNEQSKIDRDLMKLAFRGRRVLKDFRHDLRQPLSTLGILASVGKAISKEPEVTARYQHIQTAQKTLKNMLEELFEQFENAIQYPAKDGLLCLQKVSLDEVLSPLIEEYRMLANVKQLQIRYRPSELTVISNKEALTKIVRNGLDNAVKYTDKGGVVVGMCKRKGHIAIQIVDTGSGIENDKVAAHNKGWGHGSNIVRDLSEQILAKTSCRNRYYSGSLAGSIFEVILPEEAEVNQRGKLPSHDIQNPLDAQVMAMSNEHLMEIRGRLPIQGFDKVDFNLNGAYRAYICALRKGMSSVYIQYAGNADELAQATYQLKLLGTLLDYEPCCILIYRVNNESTDQIEFTREMIRIPISSRHNDLSLNVIAELFPTREPIDSTTAPVFHSASPQMQQGSGNKTATASLED